MLGVLVLWFLPIYVWHSWSHLRLCRKYKKRHCYCTDVVGAIVTVAAAVFCGVDVVGAAVWVLQCVDGGDAVSLVLTSFSNNFTI